MLHVLARVIGLVILIGCGHVADQTPKDGDIRDAPDILDAAEHSDAAIVYEGRHYGYVVSKIALPLTQAQVREYSLDLGSANSSMLDGVADNAIGVLLGLLAQENLPMQRVITEAVDRGNIIQLLDLQSTDFINANNAGLRIRFGQNPVPQPCNNAFDTICRRHLTGSAIFSIAADSPTNAIFSGSVVNGEFDGFSSEITLQLAFANVTLINLRLRHARIMARSISENDIATINIGGKVTKEETLITVVPVIQGQLKDILDRDCVAGGNGGVPPRCGCQSRSSGEALFRIFDGSVAGIPRDCQISSAEILTFAFYDSCSKATCETPDALSVGLRLEAIKATFPM